MKRIAATILAFLMAITVTAGVGLAVNPDEMLANPALEARAREISENLRCLVCQNQSIDSSDSGLARDLRVLVRERLTVGDSNDEAMAFIVARYGEFVLLRPVLAWHTLVLWAGAPLLFLGGLAGLFIAARRKKPLPESPSLSDQETEALARLSDSVD